MTNYKITSCVKTKYILAYLHLLFQYDSAGIRDPPIQSTERSKDPRSIVFDELEVSLKFKKGNLGPYLLLSCDNSLLYI